MEIKNVRKTEYFTSTAGCRIAETYGIPTAGIKEASVAFAILPSGEKTDEHKHNFLEWYIVIGGRGMMYINAEKREVGTGDNILIKKGDWHYIETIGSEDLEFYCFCVPAFNLAGTTMRSGAASKESIERKF